MRISQWRSSFKWFLEQYLTIDGGYGLSVPEDVGKYVAHFPPLFNVQYKAVPPDTALGTGEQWFYLLARYPYSIPYANLPISELEGVYSTLSLRLLWNWSRIHDKSGRPNYDPNKPILSSLDVLPNEYPLKVSEDSYQNRDWLITLCWKFRISFEAEPEVNIDATLLTELDVDIWRSQLADMKVGATKDVSFSQNYT